MCINTKFDDYIVLDENIEGGNVTLSLSYGYNIIVIKKKFDLCELVSNSSAAHCPLRPDLAMLDIKSHIPTTLPQVRRYYCLSMGYCVYVITGQI